MSKPLIKSASYPHGLYYCFVIALFILIVSFDLFSDGMFVDGLWYADISRNMAHGLGSFWHPHLSNTLFPDFYEHPPLAFGLQSLWFRLFGDSIMVERLYSLSTFFIVGFLMVLIWNELTDDKKYGWFPLLLWIIISNVFWSASNNMLENTMSIFVCFSFLSCLKSRKGHHYMWLILAGFSLTLGMLTKGFFCLYIWGTPFFFWLFKRDTKFSSVVADTVLLVAATLLPLIVLYFSIPEARDNMFFYFDRQVINSLNNVQTVSTRWDIVGDFFQNIATPLIVAFIIVGLAWKQHLPMSLLKQNLKVFLIFLAVVFSGIFPIMISLKQRCFYILTVYPIFVIGLSYFLFPMMKIMLEKINTKSISFKVFQIFTALLAIAAVTSSVVNAGSVRRDEALIHDSRDAIHIVGKNQTIGVDSLVFKNISLHGYFSRYGNMSLQKDSLHLNKYFLVEKGKDMNEFSSEYMPVPLNLDKYILLQRKSFAQGD